MAQSVQATRYFADDIGLLETLLSQAAIAMTNAQLYKEVVLVSQYVDNILSTMDSGVIAVNASGDISLQCSRREAHGYERPGPSKRILQKSPSRSSDSTAKHP